MGTQAKTVLSLKSKQSPLSDPKEQLRTLGESTEKLKSLPRFNEKLKTAGLFPLRPLPLEVFQVNIGKLCNQVCKHCHVDAGPDRKENMSRETLELCLTTLEKTTASIVDITGGAPEMNPHFEWFVEEVRKQGRKVMVRCNLTIILANTRYEKLPDFFRKNEVHIISSLPFYDRTSTDRQRGDGVFDRSIEALKRLNAVGYGKKGSGLVLDLVYNPVGAFLAAPQRSLEADFKRELDRLFGIQFNSLFTITNMPISRFLQSLVESGNLEDYLEKLVSAFNPTAATAVMCRNTLSVGWDGLLYDCDFNQMLELGIKDESGKKMHIRDFNNAWFSKRSIRTDQHCYGCTAGLGSSCKGNTSLQ